MKRFLCCGVVLLGLLLTGNAFGDGNSLLTQCAAAVREADGTLKDGSAVDAGFCLGMMQGMTNMNKYYEILLGNKALFCAPESGITNGQAARIVLKYLNDHPEKLHEHESNLALQAFGKAFPCK